MPEDVRHRPQLADVSRITNHERGSGVPQAVEREAWERCSRDQAVQDRVEVPWLDLVAAARRHDEVEVHPRRPGDEVLFELPGPMRRQRSHRLVVNRDRST